MKKKYYITTPIYYPSAKPHMGHAYSSISADFIARYKRLEGYDVKFVTGTDEHGQKIQKSADKRKLSPDIFCNEISKVFLDLTKILNLSNTDFIRTTEDRHHKTVQKLWKILEEKKFIYLSKYSGWYSVSDEAFYTESEIIEKDKIKLCEATGSAVEWVEEESYFFKLSEFQNLLIKHYEDNPEFIQPSSRRNEVMSFVKGGLNDLSISRNSFKWGISVPNSKNHIVYVWLDALTNYLTATNYFDDNSFWPADVHIIGKDILRFHAVYWPAFLLAAEIPLPKKIFGHGWILSGDEKMSKSKGNILDPIEIVDEFGLDEIRYYLMKEVMYGLDGKINIDNLKNCINSDLANNIGNLSQRIFVLINKYFSCKVPDPKTLSDEDKFFLACPIDGFRKSMSSFEIHNYIREVISYSSRINKFVNDEEPWTKAKNSDPRVGAILYVALNALKNIFILLHPVMPSKSEYYLSCLNIVSKDISLELINKNLQVNEDLKMPGLMFKKYI
jgi:methionyl-tRNA synthetase